MQDLPKNSLNLLEGIFLFSLVWSIGATVDKDGRGAFNRFLRKMLHKGVSINPDRSDFDLGPGLTIQEPEWSISVPMPTVSREGSISWIAGASVMCTCSLPRLLCGALQASCSHTQYLCPS